LTPLSTIEFNFKQSEEDNEKRRDDFSLSPFKVKKLPKYEIYYKSNYFVINSKHFLFTDG
jgi:hypothetical protein